MEQKSPGEHGRPAVLVFRSVALYWLSYVAISLSIGFITSMVIGSEVWQLTTWGFLSSLGLLILLRPLLLPGERLRTRLGSCIRISSWMRFMLGLLLGLASFGAHVAIIEFFAGPVEFRLVPEVGVLAILLYFARFLSTSCMEEVGFRGSPLRELLSNFGVWPAVMITSVAFGCSHFLYGWDAQSIALGVVPCGVLWGMSAVATRGIAVPIGLHAAWNFAGWSVGSRSELGPLEMIIEDDALDHVRTVATISNLTIFGIMTLGFWLVYRRRGQQLSSHSELTST